MPKQRLQLSQLWTPYQVWGDESFALVTETKVNAFVMPFSNGIQRLLAIESTLWTPAFAGVTASVARRLRDEEFI